MTWLIEFPYKRPPLTLNQRLHHMAKARITRELRFTAADKARRIHRIPALGRCRVELTWVVADNRRRDAENPTPTLKALCDGLVDAGIVPDDTPDLMEKAMPVIRREYGAIPHLELRVTALDTEGAAA